MSGPMELGAGACTHRGLWGLREVDGGLGVRWCEGCGLTFVLAQLDDGRFAWCRVLEHEEAVDDLAEAVLALRDAQAQQQLQPGPDDLGRAPEPVSELPTRLRPAAAPDGVPTPQTLRELPDALAHHRVRALGQGPRRPPKRVSALPSPEGRP